MMDEPRFLSAAQASKTYDYLRSLPERYPTMAVKVQSLFARCCLAANPDFTFDLPSVGREAACIADEILADPRSQELGLDPLLIVEAYLLLKSAGSDLSALVTLTKKIKGSAVLLFLDGMTDQRLMSVIGSAIRQYGNQQPVAADTLISSVIALLPEHTRYTARSLLFDVAPLSATLDVTSGAPEPAVKTCAAGAACP